MIPADSDDQHPLPPRRGAGPFAALEDDHGFEFDCVPERCDLRCCTTGHPLVLNPYEIHVICRTTNIPFDTLEDDYFSESYDPETGFPLITIARELSCRFLRDRSCTIYEARPLVCRLFPLGKYFHPEEEAFRTVILSDNACAGFSAGILQTVARYQEEQRTAELSGIWEQWAAFVTAVEDTGMLPDSGLFRSVFAMFIYNCDLPPAPGIGPEEYRSMPAEKAMSLRLETAFGALPRLRGIFEKNHGGRNRSPSSPGQFPVDAANPRRV